MEIDPEHLERFRAIYRERFGIELSPKEALEKALPLLTIMKAAYQPMTEDDLRRVQERQRTLFNN